VLQQRKLWTEALWKVNQYTRFDTGITSELSLQLSNNVFQLPATIIPHSQQSRWHLQDCQHHYETYKDIVKNNETNFMQYKNTVLNPHYT